MNETGLVHDTTELRKLIAENPELPIVVLAGEDSWWDQGYAWYFCHDVKVHIDEILDCQLPFGDGYIYNDKEDFEEALWEYLDETEEYGSYPEEVAEAAFQQELEKYKPYWKKVIAIYADN